MMKISVMRLLVDETETGDCAMPTAHTALKCWDHDEGSLLYWRTSANGLYRFEQEGIPLFLRLSYCEDRTRSMIEAELDFVRYLGGQSIPAVQAVISRNGRWIETVEGPSGRFHAVVFRNAEGKFSDVEAYTPHQIHIWGRSLGALHNASAQYKAPDGKQRPNWREYLAAIRSWLGEDEPAATRELDKLSTWMETLPQKNAYGLIHYDFETDNLAWNGTDFNIIDFDDAVYLWFAADIAFAMDDATKLPPAKTREILEGFLAGYREVRPFSEDWAATFPDFVRLMRLFKFARVKHAFAGSDPSLDRPWMAKMRAYLMAQLDTRRDSWRTPQPTPRFGKSPSS